MPLLEDLLPLVFGEERSSGGAAGLRPSPDPERLVLRRAVELRLRVLPLVRVIRLSSSINVGPLSVEARARPIRLRPVDPLGARITVHATARLVARELTAEALALHGDDEALLIALLLGRTDLD